jgi:hypothetical protein
VREIGEEESGREFIEGEDPNLRVLDDSFFSIIQNLS